MLTGSSFFSCILVLVKDLDHILEARECSEQAEKKGSRDSEELRFAALREFEKFKEQIPSNFDKAKEKSIKNLKAKL